MHLMKGARRWYLALLEVNTEDLVDQGYSNQAAEQLAASELEEGRQRIQATLHEPLARERARVKVRGGGLEAGPAPW